MALRQHGFAGRVTIIGRESEPPYERPPLSKEYLAREKPFERLYVRPPQLWAEKKVDLELGRAVTEIDPVSKTVTLDDLTKRGYTHLI